MNFRLSTVDDIKSIMNIINQGKEKLRKEKINQWQNGYPNENSIEQDIIKGYSYVMENGDKIIATASLSFDGEEDYKNLYEGQWITNDKYCVMHRVCVDLSSKVKGKGKILLDFAEEISKKNKAVSIKIDTHEENSSMRRLLEENGFLYCGITYLSTNEKRLVYEKVISSSNSLP